LNIKTKLDVKASTVSTGANYLELWTQQKQFVTKIWAKQTRYKFLINHYCQIANKLQSTARTAQFSQKTEQNHNSGEEPNCYNVS
jgi:hypothetical protein